MLVQRRVHSAAPGLQLQRVQSGLPGTGRAEALRLPTLLLSIHERNIVHAGRPLLSRYE